MPQLIRLASLADTTALMKLRIEAEGWLADAGIDQWRAPGFRERGLAKWQGNIADGRTWVVPDGNGELLGTITLARPDTDFWTKADEPDSAIYVAKLITARAAAGQRLGGRMLDWAGGVAQAQSRPWLRLDVWRDNTKLQRYYLNEGFTHVRTEAPAHRLSGWMAQRPSAMVMHPQDPLRTVDTPGLTH